MDKTDLFEMLRAKGMGNNAHIRIEFLRMLDIQRDLRDKAKHILSMMHQEHIWVKMLHGRYKGRPAWVKEIAVDANHFWFFVKIPSLKGFNEEVDFSEGVSLNSIEFIQARHYLRSGLTWVAEVPFKIGDKDMRITVNEDKFCTK